MAAVEVFEGTEEARDDPAAANPAPGWEPVVDCPPGPFRPEALVQHARARCASQPESARYAEEEE